MLYIIYLGVQIYKNLKKKICIKKATEVVAYIINFNFFLNYSYRM